MVALLLLAAQDPQAAMEQSIAKQREAAGRQRVSVRLQAKAGPEAPDAFFTTPWSWPAPVPPPYRPPECDPVSEDQIGPIVNEIAKREGLTPDLLRAVIEKESAYLPCAISTEGAQGLMQLMPETAADLGVANPFDTRENIGGGARFLKQMLDRYGGNLVLALAAYNAGPTRVDAAGGVPAIPETLGYVTGVLDRLR
ncbi:MAG: lytic transglycosylase domain-containing protein [Acidobacteriota bacterium]